MKVLLVNKFHYRKGGSETYYFTLAAALQKKGHEVIFFAMQDENLWFLFNLLIFYYQRDYTEILLVCRAER